MTGFETPPRYPRPRSDYASKVRASSIEVRPRLIALDAQERTAHFSDGVNEEVDTTVQQCRLLIIFNSTTQLERL